MSALAGSRAGLGARALELPALLLALAWLTIAAARDGALLGPAIDEMAHIGAAYDLAASGENRLNPEHPPAVKLAAGWAMRWHQGDRFGDRIPVGESTDQWRLGRSVLYPGDRLDREMLRAARFPTLLVALVGALAVWLWSRALFGAGAGLLSLALYALSPVVLAHSIFVITDLPLGVWALCATGCGWAASRSNSWRWAAAAGAFAALACLTKYSGPLVPFTALPLLVFAGSAPRPGRDVARELAVFALALGIVALSVGGVHVLGDYAAGARSLYYNIRGAYPAYAMGNVSLDGFWYYFPLVFLLKSSPAELLLLAAAAIALGWPARGPEAVSTADRLRTLAWLALFPMAYLAALVAGGKDFGGRYLAPLYPFLFVAAGACWRRLQASAARFALAGLVLLQAWSAREARPDALSYFNGLLGCSGPIAAFCLDDSNVDWGQNLPRVAALVNARLALGEVPVVGTQTLEFMPLAAHFPTAVPLAHEDWFAPHPALYAVSGQVLVRYAIQDPSVQKSPLFAALLRGEGVGNSWLLADLRQASAPAR